MMDEVLHDCLYPVMLGSNARCHALVRQMQKQYRIGSTVLTGKWAITLRFLPSVKLIGAAPTLPDELLMDILHDVESEAGMRIPLLILCDKGYDAFWNRNKEQLGARFILRRAEELLQERDL